MTRRKASHVIFANHRPTCAHCGEWIEMPIGNVDWCASVAKAFSRAHRFCMVGDRWDFPRCGWQPHPGGPRYVRLLYDVRGDWPFDSAVARAGVHEAFFNSHGAASVKAEDGSELGVKPGEFVFCGEP